jgi:hypothetical protein
MKNKLRLSALKQLAQEKGIAIIDEEVLNRELSNYEIRVSVRDIARWVLLSIASDNFSMLGDTLVIHEAYDIKDKYVEIRQLLKTFPYIVFYDNRDFYISKEIIEDSILDKDYGKRRREYLKSVTHINKYMFGQELHNCEEYFRKQIIKDNFSLLDDYLTLEFKMEGYEASELENIAQFLITYNVAIIHKEDGTFIHLHASIAK